MEKLLILRLKEKDRNAAEKLINANYQITYRFLYSLCRDRELAQDLTQDTFIKVWNGIDSFKGTSRFSTWLYRISHNLYLDHKKKRRINFSNLDRSQDIALKSMVTTNEQTDESDFHAFVFRKVHSLPQNLEEILLLHYQEDLSLRQIAQILQIPRGTVKSRLHAALKRMRKNLNDV